MNQQTRLDQTPLRELIWATVKYDELLQTVYQNQILVKTGMWKKLFCNSSDIEMQIYHLRRQSLIATNLLDEDALRREVLEMIVRR